MSILNYKFNKKLLVVAACVVLAIAVVIAIGSRSSNNPTEVVASVAPNIDTALQQLLTRYQVDGKSTRSRKVPSGDRTFSRMERRVTMPPEFNTLDFNHDLNQAVQEFGATAIATEKSEDKSVTMHIKKDGVIVQSIVFVVNKDGQSRVRNSTSLQKY